MHPRCGPFFFSTFTACVVVLPPLLRGQQPAHCPGGGGGVRGFSSEAQKPAVGPSTLLGLPSGSLHSPEKMGSLPKIMGSWTHFIKGHGESRFPFFPGSSWFLKRTMVEKKGNSNPSTLSLSKSPSSGGLKGNIEPVSNVDTTKEQ